MDQRDVVIKRMNGETETVTATGPVIIKKVDDRTDEIFILPKAGGCCRECGADVDDKTWKETRPLCRRCWNEDGQ